MLVDVFMEIVLAMQCFVEARREFFVGVFTGLFAAFSALGRTFRDVRLAHDEGQHCLELEIVLKIGFSTLKRKYYLESGPLVLLHSRPSHDGDNKNRSPVTSRSVKINEKLRYKTIGK